MYGSYGVRAERGIRIRVLTDGDVVGVRELRSVVRWFDDPGAFDLLRGMRDARWSVAEDSSGKLVGMVGAVPLGRVGVLCHLAVGESHRGMGIGTLLASWAVAYLKSCNATVVRLYSTSAAEGLYGSLGFRGIGEKSIYRKVGGWEGEPGIGEGVRVSELTFGDLPELYGVDFWACGLDRSHIIISTLRTHPGSGLLARDSSRRIRGYLVRSYSQGITRIGPLLASDDDVAKVLLHRSLEARRTTEVGVVGDASAAFMRELGFEGQRDKVCMELDFSPSGSENSSRGLRQYATTAYLST